MRSYLRPFRLLVATLVTIGAAWMLQSSPADESASAIYSAGVLHVTIPYDLAHSGAGQLTVEILNPEDQAVATVKQQVNVSAGGVWHEDLKPATALKLDDLVWYRLRYRFAFTGERENLSETRSISEILRMPVLRVLADRTYLSGGQASVRVIVTDSANQPISGKVKISLEAAGQPDRPLFAGTLNQRGTAEPAFTFPPKLTGNFRLHSTAETALGDVDSTQDVILRDSFSILLTTEKPLYQPGQTIHLRALALDRAHHEAVENRPLTFEVMDARGNKVFRKTTQTDKFGIASTEFLLADEVNLGAWHLNAAVENAGHSELTVNVERYVLPKFKVAVEFDGQHQHGYRPGDHVTGTVRANYFFGKPVDQVEVTLKATGMDVAEYEVATASGKTDGDGAWRFDLKLPDYFAGKPLSQGAARVLLEATVKDATGHSETRGEPVTVSQSPLLITAVPEAGAWVPGLENRVFVVTSYADGQPAATDVTVHIDGQPDRRATTDAGGVAIVQIAAGQSAPGLHIQAADKDGNRGESSVQLAARTGADQILLRAERAVYRAGDIIRLKVLSTSQHGTAYVDVIKNSQTVLTRDIDLVNGQGEMEVPATPDLAGTLDCNAYLIGRNAQTIADHRLLFVQPTDDLKIEASSDAADYKPGGDARINFRVTNSHGQGVEAAIGVQVVDEAVFALAEKQPGFAKVFFYLEQEAMKPRYEIHSLGLPEAVAAVDAQHDRAAQALFAASEVVNGNVLDTLAGRTVPMVKLAEYTGRYDKRLEAEALAYANRYGLDAKSGTIDLRDAWGTHLEVTSYRNRYYQLRSAGPDRQFNTQDDQYVSLEETSLPVVGKPSTGSSSIDVSLEHNRGPMVEAADISGVAIDQSGRAVENCDVALREVSSGKTRKDRSNSDGAFQFSAVPAGQYEVTASAGSESLATSIAVAARDRASIHIALRHQPERSFAFAVARPMPPPQRAFMPLQVMAMAGVGGGGGGGARRMAPAAAPRGVIGGVADALTVTGSIAADSNGSFNATLGSIGAAPSPHVRSYFPEALYINPEIITDGDGRASISIPLADSITTWRMAMVASTPAGSLGSGASSIKVFQDFFTDLDLPVTLTQGDQLSVPVAIYNYSGARGDVQLNLQPADWYSLVNDTAEKSVAVDAGRTAGSQFTLRANRIGKFKFTLSARMPGATPGTNRADIVVREIEVVPNGREQAMVFNGRVDGGVHHRVDFPPTAIPDASAVLVRLYPGPLSQVIEGMDSILKMPYGCFEQTSSSTYPNVLTLDYMKRTKKITAEIRAKAEGFIAQGYQRLLTFEVQGGGFSWFGQAPANKILTSYGLMEFSDMSKVYDVDANVIRRTQQWLANQQQPDGSWKPDTNFINEGATNRFNSDSLRISAYIAWALENTGYKGAGLDRARHFVDTQMSARDAKPDSYTLAVVANFAVESGDREFAGRAIQRLLDARVEKGDQVWWTSEQTGVFSTGESATVETTGLAAQALLKWGQSSTVVTKALAYIASKKTANGAWSTTQATIMALRSLLLSQTAGGDARGSVEVALNGRTVETVTLTADNNDLFHQFVIKPDGANSIDIQFHGTGSLAYQVVGRYFVPWDARPASEPLSIDVAFDRTSLAQNDVATATATVRNNLGKSANMVMVDLGIPPGFDLLSEDLQQYQEQSAHRSSGRLEKFSLTATQAILYFDSIAAGDSIKLTYRFRAKYPIRAHTFPTRAYEYYDPDVNSVARPVLLEVK